MKFGTKSERLLKRDLIVSLYIMINLKTKVKSYEGKINTKRKFSIDLSITSFD